MSSPQSDQFVATPAPVNGKFEVAFKLGNLSHSEMHLCACFKALLCDERFEHLRRRLKQGGHLQLNGDGSLHVAVPAVPQPGNPALN